MTHRALLLAAIGCLGAGPLQAQNAAFDTVAVGRKASELFLGGSMDSLWALLTPGFQADIENTDWLNQRLMFIVTNAGREIRVIEESIRMRNGQPQYWRTAEFESAPEPLMIRWVISPDGKVSGLGMNPASQAPPTDDEKG